MREFSEAYSTDNKALSKRYINTMRFLKSSVKPGAKILDLGIPNMFADLMKGEGFEVDNTPMGMDLDLDYEVVKDEKYDVVTAFEIFEHLVSPFPLLQNIKADKLVCSVPMKLWFAEAYWNADDPYDRHYHEFEAKQFDMLLDKAGWKIEKSEQWKNPSGKFGIRPFLRSITPRYYIVSCVRK